MVGKLKPVWWKVSIIIFCCILDMGLHALQNTDLSKNDHPSFIFSHGLFVPAVIIWELLAFGILALIFLKIESGLPGKGWQKGLTFGLSFGGLYQIGMFEGSLLLHTKMINEFFMGLGDFLPILLMGILLGHFATDKSSVKRKKTNPLSIAVVSAFYIVGRYLAYAVVNIQSAYRSEPFATLIWTVSMGVWIGVIYWLLEPASRGKSKISKSLFFAVAVFMPNWLINHLFIITVIEVTPDIFIRIANDIVFITFGAIASKLIVKEKQTLL
jgi:hypothetical protein